MHTRDPAEPFHLPPDAVGPSSWRWTLPARPRGVVVPLFAAAAGFVAVAAGFGWFAQQIDGLTAGFAAIPAVIGVGVLGFALVLLLHRSEVTVDAAGITVTQRVGPWSSTRRVPGAAIGTVRVEQVVFGAARGRAATEGVSSFAALKSWMLDGSGARRAGHTLAWGYPAAWLEDVAAQVAFRLEVAGASRGATGSDTPVRVEQTVDAADRRFVDDAEPAAPSVAVVAVEEAGDRWTARVRPRSMWRRRSTWGGLMTVVSAAAFAALLVLADVPGAPVAGVAVIGLAGVGMIGKGWHAARRVTVLDLVGRGRGATLLVTTRAPFAGVTQRELPGRTIERLQLIHGGHRLPTRLLARTTAGEEVALLTDEQRDALRWVASQLQRRTGWPGREHVPAHRGHGIHD